MFKQTASIRPIDGKIVYCVKTLAGRSYFVAANSKEEARVFVRDRLKKSDDVAHEVTQTIEVYVI